MAGADPLDEAEFLVRSENRVRVLQHLAVEAADRTTLENEAEVSRVTLGRILGDFEERNWVDRGGPEYRLTTLGETAVEGMEIFFDSVEATQRLRTVVEYLPVAELDIPLRHLNTATVIRPTEGEPSKYLRSLVPAADEADRILGLWSVFDPDMLRRHRNRAVDERTDVEFVFGDDVLAVARPANLGRFVAELGASEDGAVYEYDGALPGTVLVMDQTVFLLLVGDNGYQGVVESENETIREWAETTIETYRDRSTRVDPAAFDAFDID